MRFILAVGIGWVVFCAPSALANITVTIRDSDGNVGHVRTKAGDTITVFLEVTASSPTEVISGQFFIKDLGDTGWLTVTDYTWNPLFVEDFAPALDYTLHDGPFTSYPGAGHDEWGATDSDLSAPFGTTTFTLLTLDLQISATAPSKGSTRINVTDLVFGDSGFNDLTAVAGPSYSIEVPAPGAVLLGGIGLGLVGWIQRRRPGARPAAAAPS